MAKDKWQHPGYDALTDTIKTPRPVSDPLGAGTNFAKLETIGGLASDRTGRGCDWTPREVLIDVLRQLDAGEIDPDTLLVGWAGWRKDDDTARLVGQRFSYQDPMAMSGLIARVQNFYDGPHPRPGE